LDASDKSEEIIRFLGVPGQSSSLVEGPIAINSVSDENVEV
jgi:hypothetical protein